MRPEQDIEFSCSSDTDSAASTHTINRMSTHPQRFEVITRGERRRRWSVEEKYAIVAESLTPNTSLNGAPKSMPLSAFAVGTAKANRASVSDTIRFVLAVKLPAEPIAGDERLV